MSNYTKDEINSATAIARHFGGVLDKLAHKKVRKVAVLRNNKMEAVILPIDEYERLTELEAAREHEEIERIVSKRKRTSKSKYIALEDIEQKYELT